MRRIALTLGLLSLSTATPAHASPTSATTLRHTVDTGPTRILVAVERKSARQLRVVMLRVDDQPDDDAYVVTLAAGACKTGPELLRINVRDRAVIDQRRRIPREAIGGRLQW